MHKALFFPSYRGGGFGHIGRCLALAQELECRDWQTAFVLQGQHVPRVQKAGQSVLQPRQSLLAAAKQIARLFHRKPKPSPAYTIFSSMNFQIVRDGFYNARTVHQRVAQELTLVRQFDPDLLIGDGWPLTSIVGQLAELPVAQIVKSVVHPSAPNLLWWQTPPPDLVSPDVRSVFNPALTRWKLAPIEQAEDLLTGDLLLVPSIPRLDPLPQEFPRTHYVGPLIWSNTADAEAADWLNQLTTDHPLLYVTFGGGADAVGSAHLYAALCQALGNQPFQVVVSTSAKFAHDKLPTPPANFLLKRWVPGLAMIARSDAIIFHGGYGTMMETVYCAVPSLIIPFHTEQEANGRRLEANGASTVLRHSEGPYKPVQHSWQGGTFSYLVAAESTLDPIQIRHAVSRILSEEFRENMLQLQKEQKSYGGPSFAVELLETMLGGMR